MDLVVKNFEGVIFSVSGFEGGFYFLYSSIFILLKISSPKLNIRSMFIKETQNWSQRAKNMANLHICRSKSTPKIPHIFNHAGCRKSEPPSHFLAEVRGRGARPPFRNPRGWQLRLPGSHHIWGWGMKHCKYTRR